MIHIPLQITGEKGEPRLIIRESTITNEAEGPDLGLEIVIKGEIMNTNQGIGGLTLQAPMETGMRTMDATEVLDTMPIQASRI